MFLDRILIENIIINESVNRNNFNIIVPFPLKRAGWTASTSVHHCVRKTSASKGNLIHFEDYITFVTIPMEIKYFLGYLDTQHSPIKVKGGGGGGWWIRKLI